MSKHKPQYQTNFAIWLEKQIEALEIDSKTLSRRSGLEYSYIRRILTDRKPSLNAAKRIGSAIGKPQEALIAAGFSAETITDQKDEVELKELFPIFLYLNWLERLSLLNKKQAELFKNIFQKAHLWHLEKSQIKKTNINEFLKVFNANLQLVLSLPKGKREYGPLTYRMVDFALNQPKPSIYSEKFKEIHQDPEFKSLFILTKIFKKLDYEDGLQIICPYVMLPLRILRVAFDPAINLHDITNNFDLDNTELAKVTKHFREKHENYSKILPGEQDSLIQMAKYASEYLWDTLGLGYETLTTSVDFYDSKVLYQKDRTIYVFATTAGLFIPGDYHGSQLPSLLKTTSKTIDSKNPLRLSYFEDGILHGLRTGCKVYYQSDITRTKDAWQKGYKEAVDKDRYFELSVDILFKFFKEENIEISLSTFETNESKMDFDWRNWLTLTSEKFVVLSARQPVSKKMVHGLLIGTNLFNNAIPSTLEFDSVYKIAEYLNNRDKTVIKEIGKTKSKKDAEKFLQGMLESD